MRTGDRIKILLDQTGRRRSELAKYLNVSVQAVAGWLTGNSEPLPAKREQIARFFGISEEELLFGPASDRPSRSVPVISWADACNPVRTVDNVEATYREERMQVSIPCLRHTFALTVKGDSMVNPSGFPSFPPGTRIAAEPEEEPLVGDFVLARVDGNPNAVFGQLAEEMGRRFLKPLNPRYPVIELSEQDAIVAVVLEYGARLR